MENNPQLGSSQCSILPSNLLVDGIIYDNQIDIANLFDAHFVNIASSVVLNKNAPNWGYLKDFVSSKLPLGVSFTIPPITSVFVLDSLRHLPTGKAVGLGGLSGYFLKLLAPSIASSLRQFLTLASHWVFSPIFGKRLKYRLHLRTVLYLTALIIDPFLFLHTSIIYVQL